MKMFENIAAEKAEKIQVKRPENVKSRTQRPEIYPDRYPVPDEKVSWEETFDEYSPENFVAPVVLKNDITINPKGWADPEAISKVTHDIRFSYTGPIKLNEKGQPMNPNGRTGLEGRGLLGKWGANFAADPVITRINPETRKVEMLAIQRDTGEWAIPGGMVDAGEAVTKTLMRELKEETGVDLSMEDAEEIYRGYVDDPRNTDNAWMETTLSHKHVSDEQAKQMQLQAGDDAKAVKWLSLDKDALQNLYASHGEMIRRVMLRYKQNHAQELDQQTINQLEEMTNIEK